jgi:hypothetical protein
MVLDAPPKASNFSIEPVPSDDATVRTLLGEYLRRFRLPESTAPATNTSWFAVYEEGGDFCLAFAGGLDRAGGFVGTDFYVVPSRAGVRAVYWVLENYKQMLDCGVWPYAIVSVLTQNKVMRRRIEKVFGIPGPTTVSYTYGKAVT